MNASYLYHCFFYRAISERKRVEHIQNSEELRTISASRKGSSRGRSVSRSRAGSLSSNIMDVDDNDNEDEGNGDDVKMQDDDGASRAGGNESVFNVSEAIARDYVPTGKRERIILCLCVYVCVYVCAPS